MPILKRNDCFQKLVYKVILRDCRKANELLMKWLRFNAVTAKVGKDKGGDGTWKGGAVLVEIFEGKNPDSN